jgi:integral membrane protein
MLQRSSSIQRLRIIGITEGISFLVLLGIAMPLKYFAGMASAVTAAGWIHGLLFMGFCVALTQAREEAKWGPAWSATVLIAALLPFGPFLIDKRLRRESEVGQRSSH